MMETSSQTGARQDVCLPASLQHRTRGTHPCTVQWCWSCDPRVSQGNVLLPWKPTARERGQQDIREEPWVPKRAWRCGNKHVPFNQQHLMVSLGFSRNKLRTETLCHSWALASSPTGRRWADWLAEVRVWNQPNQILGQLDFSRLESTSLDSFQDGKSYLLGPF